MRCAAPRSASSASCAEAFFGYPQATGTTASPEFGMAVATEKMKSGWKPPAGSRHPPMVAAFAAGLLDFLAERLRVQLRSEGARHDVVAAVFGAAPGDDLVRLLARSDALARMLATPDGANLLSAYKRAANILRIENRKDGPHDGAVDPALLAAGAERTLAEVVTATRGTVTAALAREDFLGAMESLATLRAPVDAFFDQVVVNDADPQLRRNRLRLLNTLCAAMDAVADVSKIEG
jgi:glycyl-tRNA synthetase beta chain